ncbi:MAG: transporter [Pseudomonadales bacterium]
MCASSIRADEEDFSKMDLVDLVEVNIYVASVLFAHIHNEGEWMFDYSHVTMKMDGNLDGTRSVSASEVLASYRVTPLDMTMDMDMFMVMYAPSDELTLMMMLQWVEKEMKHQTQMGTQFTTRSSGMGDTTLSANYVVMKENTDFGEQEYTLTVGISLPTGSTDEEDFLPPMGNVTKLPYPMQLGSGTYDAIVGGAYLGFSDKWYWGAQGLATIRSAENDEGYRLGNRIDLKLWLTRAFNDSLSGYVRVDAHKQENIKGADPDLNPMMVPTADPDLRAQKMLSLTFGVDAYASKGMLEGHRVGLAVGKPIFQRLDGPQLETDLTVRFDWQLVF